MKKLLIIFSILSFFHISCKGQTDNKLEGIKIIFKRMELGGVNVNQKLLYGYFFYNRTKSNLEQLKNEVAKQGYEVVKFGEYEKEKFVLHVQKKETHTINSLYEKEKEFESYEKKYTIDSYDGWDVGNIDPTKPLISREKYIEFVKNKPDSELFNYAIEVYDNEMYEDAVIAFDNCIIRGIKKDTSYYKLGNSLVRLGQIELGIAQLEQAIKLNPSYYSAYFNVGAICYDNNMLEKSADYYTKAINIKPNDDRAYYGLAASQYASGNITAGEKNCLKALELNPKNENALELMKIIERDKLNKK